MLFRKRLKCSFCGKSAAEVTKLVTGPRAYICDACVAIASRIMSESDGPTAASSTRKPFWHRVVVALSRLRGVRRAYTA